MKASIRVSSFLKNINMEINTQNNSCLVNGNSINMDTQNFVDRLLEIVTDWQFNYNLSMGVDFEKFEVVITDSQKTVKYFGCGDYPQNYSKFIDLVSEVEND